MGLFRKYKGRKRLKYSEELVQPLGCIIEGYKLALGDRLRNNPRMTLVEMARVDERFRFAVHGFYVSLLSYYAYETCEHIPQLDVPDEHDMEYMETELTALVDFLNGKINYVEVLRW